MNSLSTMNNTNTLTISSLEIAQITGKEHKHVLRDIKAMLNELGGVLSFEDTYIHSADFSAQYKEDSKLTNTPT